MALSFIMGILCIGLGCASMVYLLSNGFRVRCRNLIPFYCGISLLILSCFTSIPTGYTGLLVTFGRVSDATLDAGLCFKAPWQTVIRMDNRIQKDTQSVEAFSSDSQEVEVSYSINYSIDKSVAMNLYRRVGPSYYDKLVLPRSKEDLKSVFAQYTADQLIINRGILADSVLILLQQDLQNSGVNILSISIEDIDFTDAYTTAVEQKQVAAQRKLQAQTEEEQKTMEAEAAAERSRIAAQAEADVVRIQAESAQYAGEREAEMNKKLAENLSAELVQYYYIQNWDGHLPSTMLGGASEVFPVIDIPHTLGNAE